MRAEKRQIIALALSMIALSGCTSTPQSGPGYRAVESSAAVTVSAANKNCWYRLRAGRYQPRQSLPTPAKRGRSRVLEALARQAMSFPIFRWVWAMLCKCPFLNRSRVDCLFLQMREADRATSYTLPSQTIGRNGYISVPYAGLVRAAGRQTIDLQRDIEKTLANRAIEPQVLINKVSSRSAVWAVLGDVKAPAKVELSEGGDRILDVISQAGGLNAPVRKPTSRCSARDALQRCFMSASSIPQARTYSSRPTIRSSSIGSVGPIWPSAHRPERSLRFRRNRPDARRGAWQGGRTTRLPCKPGTGAAVSRRAETCSCNA